MRKEAAAELFSNKSLQNFFEPAAQFGGEARVFAAGGDGDLHVAAVEARGDDEIALFGGIGDIGEQAAAFCGDADAVVGEAVVGGGEDEKDAGEIAGAEAAAHDAHGKLFKLRFAFGSDNGDARAGFEEPAGLAESNLTGADDEHGPVFEIEEDGVVFQF